MLLKKLAAAAAAGREIVGAVTGCDNEGGKVSCVMETLQRVREGDICWKRRSKMD